MPFFWSGNGSRFLRLYYFLDHLIAKSSVFRPLILRIGFDPLPLMLGFPLHLALERVMAAILGVSCSAETVAMVTEGSSSLWVSASFRAFSSTNH